MSVLRLTGDLDPNFGWADGALWTGADGDPGRPIPSRLRGAYASAWSAGGAARLVRDPLGLNKLFWAPAPDPVTNGHLVVAARPRDLVEAGCGFCEIRAVPPGVVIDYGLDGQAVDVRALRAPRRESGATRPVEEIAAGIRETLDRYAAALAAAGPGTRVFVCLSGGLDSSGAAVLARRHFAEVTAVSFDLHRRGGEPSADRMGAARLAGRLGLPLLEITVTPEELLDGLDLALVEGIDWRDFNVHAALVNVALAKGISASASRPAGALVITGDLPNEYLCDYHPEEYRGRTFYPLPRLGPAALQGALVRGLETSHREIGPLRAAGLRAVQVYAPAVDGYLALPESFLADPRRKERLCRLIFGDAIPEEVYARPKIRAQAGDVDAGRGVLGLCIDRGIDDARLRRRFAELHGIDGDAGLDRFMRAGRYRSEIPVPGGEQ